MTQFISVEPSEKGTAVVTLAFKDEDGNTVVPTSLAWQLMEMDGTVINNRSFAEGSFVGTSIVLSGLDLAIFGSSDSGRRILSVQGVYTSAAGSDLPLKDECKFAIDKLVGQVDES